MPRKKRKTISELISLKGKRALITGAASGIGKAIALRFAEAGSNLELVDINEELLKKIEKELKKYKVEVNTHIVDLTKWKEIDKLWDKLKGKEPEILVNNAGVYPFKKFLEVDRRFIEKVFSLNFESVFRMCQKMIKGRLNKGGVIVNIASIEAITPFKNDLSVYSASKGGVITLTRTLAKEFGKKFRVNAVVPGGIMTQTTKDLVKKLYKLEGEFIKAGIEYMWRLPFTRLGDPDEVARIVLVLSSDLSTYVNGTLVVVDGGFLSA